MPSVGIAGAAAGWLLGGASTYLRERGQYRRTGRRTGGGRHRGRLGRPTCRLLGAATNSAGC